MSSRQPSFFERYYILRGAHGLYSNFNISAKYNKKILAINLSNALRSLILENPVFAVNFFRDNANDILEDGANFTLRPLDFVRFDTVVTFRKLPSPQFNETTFREIDKLVVKVDQKNQPLWRVIVWSYAGIPPTELSTELLARLLDEQYITFYCDHALFDGTSGTFFHDLLLKHLDRFDSNPNSASVADILFKNTIPSILVPELNSKGLALYNPPTLLIVTKLVEKIFTPEIVNRIIARIASYLFPDEYINTFDYPFFQSKVCKKGEPTHYKLISFTPDEVRNILAGCKLNGLTLTPFLLVIANQCLQETIIKRAGGKNMRYSSETIVAINNRRYLPAHCASEIGCLISGIEVALPPLPTESSPLGLIPQMKYVSRQIKHYLDINYGSKFVGLIKYVKVMDFFQYKVGKHSRQTLELSNLGNKNFKQGSWEAVNLFFSQSNGIATHFALSIISTRKLGMNISFGYTHDFVDFPDAIEDFVRLFRKSMLEINSK